jgi:hypothetical protein
MDEPIVQGIEDDIDIEPLQCRGDRGSPGDGENASGGW